MARDDPDGWYVEKIGEKNTHLIYHRKGKKHRVAKLTAEDTEGGMAFMVRPATTAISAFVRAIKTRD